MGNKYEFPYTKIVNVKMKDVNCTNIAIGTEAAVKEYYESKYTDVTFRSPELGEVALNIRKHMPIVDLTGDEPVIVAGNKILNTSD